MNPQTSSSRPTDELTQVLIAEDDPISRKLLGRFFKQRDYDVLYAEDGEEAWEIFQEHLPPLVVTDTNMPRRDGLDLCRLIRSNAERNYTYVLILTSTQDQEALEQGFAAGADDFMTKPFNWAELEWRVHSGLRVLDLQQTLASRIKQLVAVRGSLEAANETMKAGLDAAAKTQRSLLPATAPDVADTECAWVYEPSDHLGGDTLNVFKLDDSLLGFYLADVCGHGLPPALLAVSLHRVMSPAEGHAGLLSNTNSDESMVDFFGDPGRVLTEVNRRFPMNIENGEYFTAVYGVIDITKRELRFAGAGHPSPILISASGKIARLATDGLPVGFDDATEYETQIVSFEPGDRFFAYTDGVIESLNSEREMFGMDRLVDELRSCKDVSINGAIQQLLATRAAWEEGQEDDISMVAIEYVKQSNKNADQPDDSKTLAAP